MKRTRLRLTHSIFTVVCAAAIALGALVATGCVAAGKASPAAVKQQQGEGRLIIVRSANLGSAVVGVSVDGEEKAKINFNGRYEAPLSAGEHTITVIPVPNREFAKPSQLKIMVQAGQTYKYTAKRSDVAIILK